MTSVSVSRNCRVVRRSAGARLRGVADESNLALVVNVISAREQLRTLRRRVQQVDERWNRSVVQVRSTRPDAIERHIRVAVGLAEMFKAMHALREQECLA